MNNLRWILIFTVLFVPGATQATCPDAGERAGGSCAATSSNWIPANRGAARASSLRFAAVVNVKDFGAVGDGMHNDLPAIEKAIAATDGIVFFPEGTYKIDDTLVVEKPIVLMGSGVGSSKESVILGSQCGQWSRADDHSPVIRIRPAPGSPDPQPFAGVTVERLTLDGGCAARNFTWQFSAGIEVQARGSAAPRNVHLRNLHIRDVSGDGITVRGMPEGNITRAVPSEIFIEDNFIERWHADRQGVAIVSGSRVVIADNHIALGIPASGVCPPAGSADPTDANYGVDLETHPGKSGEVVSQVQISGNVIHNCNGGINIATSNYPDNSISNVTVHGNTIRANGRIPRKPLQIGSVAEGVRGVVEYDNRREEGRAER